MATNAGSLDTNVILRLLLNDIPDQHQASLRLFEDPSAAYAIADTAVIEIVFVLARNYGFSREQIGEAVSGLVSLPQINANAALFERALPLFLNRPALAFEDCCLAAYAELQHALPLWTFDQKLARQANGARLVTA